MHGNTKIKDLFTFKMGQIGRPEMTARNYNSTLHPITEECTSQDINS